MMHVSNCFVGTALSVEEEGGRQPHKYLAVWHAKTRVYCKLTQNPSPSGWWLLASTAYGRHHGHPYVLPPLHHLRAICSCQDQGVSCVPSRGRSFGGSSDIVKASKFREGLFVGLRPIFFVCPRSGNLYKMCPRAVYEIDI